MGKLTDLELNVGQSDFYKKNAAKEILLSPVAHSRRSWSQKEYRKNDIGNQVII